MNNSEIKNIFVQLSHVNKENRDNGINLVYDYIEKNKNTLKKREITYICTGLFYYYWLCYSIDEQKKSALKICRLIHSFDGKFNDHDKNHVFLFLQCFLQTMSVKYENLDVYRLNKFLFLFRVFQAEFLMFLHNYSWRSIYIKKYNKIIMNIFDDTNDVFHAYIDTFFKEFMENEVYLKLKKEDHGYNTKQFLLLIDPFFKIVCKTKKKYTIDLIQKKIFFMVLKINIKRHMLLERINSYIDKCPNKYGSKILKNFYNLFDTSNTKKNKINIKYKTPIFIANYNNDKNGSENTECNNESLNTEGKVMDEENENNCFDQKAKKKNKKKNDIKNKIKKIKTHTKTNRIINAEDKEYINMLLKEINGSKKGKKIYDSLFTKKNKNKKIPLSFIKLMLKEMYSKKKKSLRNKFKQINDAESNDISMKKNELKKKKKKIMLMPKNQTINTEFELEGEKKKGKKEKLLKKKDKKVKKSLKKTLLIHEPRLGDKNVLNKTILKKEKTKSSTPKKVHFDLKKNTIEYIPCAKKKNVNSYFFLDNFRNLINVPSFL
ncbi:nucleolar protein Nop52, putative [Plasmodium berghei]|uniref:Nucleolar protein Nop52, putative n=2 Tax=Plasmodium berghei TaxID=5821 RepID=A0A509AHF0_PLABA|nr:nucleolar protein Nop52, putative [Plasmodium berghei ANKA]CXI36366.1 nucleolar protein Nop52, putative [Plasmodium berghei]SCM21583.1 nucleolar protein Nop52, putative [Plasmodium berghei]SCN24783.1 nucleolar protein Nop52, putative [Plasmodium berghei]SCO59914.1 nucleolar protein Nop52, putative [Plasmodium berghei]SCO61257.1 nucleolar protein Nop52, putative [Plasmodium berghei]|eukprot:XP_034421293.1 nucleolar protein Nop52, putative [Plasmodium berghei ANKA]